MIEVPKKWQKAADKAEKKGANLSVLGKKAQKFLDQANKAGLEPPVIGNFSKLRANMSPERQAKADAKAKEMLEGISTGWRFMELLWYERGKVLVIKTMDPKNMVKFLRGFGLKFAQEKHGDGPLHYACQIGTRVLEVYPHD